jgi:hypothetical protein
MSPSLAMTKVWWPITSWAPVLNRAASIRSAMASPTAFEIPCPSGPVVVSMPAASPRSGCPAVGLPSWRKFFRSSSSSP